MLGTDAMQHIQIPWVPPLDKTSRNRKMWTGDCVSWAARSLASRVLSPVVMASLGQLP